MAKTLLQLRTLLSDATQELRNARGVDPVISDLNDQLNWAYRTIASKCYLVGQNPITLTASQSTYNLRDGSCTSAKIIRPLTLFIASATSPGTVNPLFNPSGRDYGFWNVNDLNRTYPARFTDPVGIPIAAAKLSYNQIILYPTPDTTTANLSGHSIYGIYLPADMALDTDQPDLPEEIHEAIAWLAAQYAATPTLPNDKAAWDRITAYQTYWSEIIKQVADENARSMSALGSRSGFSDDEFMLM